MATTVELEIKVSKKYEALVPRMPDEEYQSLKKDIEENGQDRSIVVNQNGVVLDGHHRFRICQELGRECKYEVKVFENELEEELYVINSALLRRHLDIWQRGQLVLKKKPIVADLAKIKLKEAQERGRETRYNEEEVVETGVSKNLESPEEDIEEVVDDEVPEEKPLHTDEELAKESGISNATLYKINQINKWVEENPDKKLEIGWDDRTYSQLKEALDDKKMKVSKVYNMIKQDQELIESKAKAKEMITELQLPEKVTLLNKDSTKVDELQEIKDNSVDLIITDPPYSTDSLPLYEGLAKLASKKLKDGGSLVFYFGQHILPDILTTFSQHATNLTYWWMFAVKHESSNMSKVHNRGVRVMWKPMLWFVKGDKRLVKRDMYDLIESTSPDKKQHPWAQSHIEATYITENLTVSEDSIVVDPFIGSGEFAIPAIKLNRWFVGIEIDEKVYKKAKQYISEQINNDDGNSS